MSGEKERINQETGISDAALRSLARTLPPFGNISHPMRVAETTPNGKKRTGSHK